MPTPIRMVNFSAPAAAVGQSLVVALVSPPGPIAKRVIRLLGTAQNEALPTGSPTRLDPSGRISSTDVAFWVSQIASYPLWVRLLQFSDASLLVNLTMTGGSAPTVVSVDDDDELLELVSVVVTVVERVCEVDEDVVSVVVVVSIEDDVVDSTVVAVVVVSVDVDEFDVEVLSAGSDS